MSAFTVTYVNAGPEPYDVVATSDKDGAEMRIRFDHADYPPVAVGSVIEVTWAPGEPDDVVEPTAEEVALAAKHEAERKEVKKGGAT